MRCFGFAFIIAICSATMVHADDYVYAQIVGTAAGMFTKKVTVEIDYGQASKYFERQTVKGGDGKSVKFNSMVDAMNWMGRQGWEFCQAYVVTMGNQNVYHWLMKKNTSDLSEQEKGEVFKLEPEK